MTPHTAPDIAVVGLGAVGEPLLRMLYGAGHRVVGVDRHPQVLARVERSLKEAEVPPPGPDGTPGVLLVNDLARLGAVETVIEAVTEDWDTKAEVLRSIGRHTLPRAVVLTTTARLPVTGLALASGRPRHTLGLRLFTPPRPGGPAALVETGMVLGEAVACADRLVARSGLRKVTVAAGPAGDAADLVYGLLNQAAALYAEGHASRDDIDTAMRSGCGLPMGPLALLDAVGLDTVRTALERAAARTGDPFFRPADVLRRLCAEGSTGRAAGQGFYTYDRLGDPKADGPAAPSAGQPRETRRVGVVGSGTMARGIAQVVTRAGVPTVLVARSEQRAAEAVRAVDDSMVRAVRRGRLKPADRARAAELLEGAGDLQAVAGCDLVIEAVVEDMEVKRKVFASLGRICAADAVLATTTSSLSVAGCAAPAGRPERVVGLHFFNPAPAMRLVELVHTSGTAADTVATARAFCERVGRTAVGCTDRAGFVVNRLLFPYLGAAVRLLARDDADIEETDAAVEQGFGFPMGPFALLDTVGLDVSLAICRRLHAAFPEPATAPPPLLESAVTGGLFGNKNGQGFCTHTGTRVP
ncbi:3-hydroxyacyl-CoA dehydrogenase family protein [Streptomyces sp. NPDC059278]|uniref:3-hydroxyacyl-CoA dehydrogenase family protein n=1 Tax=Streptomyces sp. NPDC059278 TaxID=3346801 RepID=UPI0036742181